MTLSKTMRKLGWWAFWLMWIPFFSMVVLPDGDHAWSELPLFVRYSLAVSGVLGVVSTILLIGAPIVSALRNNEILARDLPAQATIIKVTDTGTTIQNRKDKRDYLATWFQNFGKAQEIVPRVQKELEKTEAENS